MIRDHISALFTSVHAEADAVPFENGRDRTCHLAGRDRIRRWLSVLRMIYLLELPYVPSKRIYKEEKEPSDSSISRAQFWVAIAISLRHIADCFDQQLRGLRYEHTSHPRVAELLTEVEANDGVPGREHINDSASPYLLATLLDELEADVLSEPVFHL